MNIRFKDLQDTSWVNLFTNEAFIKNLDTTSLSNIIIGQKFPKEIFFSFIHEGTHHWCFTSYVGYALFLARMRAYESSCKIMHRGGGFSSTDERWDIYTDHIRFTTLQRILQPLIEGMALFAEYDSFPTDTEAIPPHLVYSAVVFCGIPKHELFKNGNDVKKIEDSYRDFLYEKRFRGDGVIRKSELLVSSMSVSKSPYLAGYLFVKNLQRILFHSSSRFIDPNLFLNFLWAYIFNDFGLVNIVLDENIKDESVPIVFCQYFENRIANLQYLHPGVIDKYEKEIVHHSTDPNTFRLLTSEKTMKSAIEKLNTGVLYLQEQAVSDMSILLFMRRFFRVSQFKVYITINEKQITIDFRFPEERVAKDKVSFLMETGMAKKRDGYLDVFSVLHPNEQKLATFEGEVLFEKYLMLSDLSRHFTLFTKEDQVIYHWFDGNWESNEQGTVLEYFKKRSQFPADHKIDEMVETCLRESQPSFEAMEEYYYKKLYEQLDEYYKNLALDCPDEALPLVKEKMKENGFWEIVDRRVDLLDGLSLISMMCSNCSKPFEATELRRDNPLLWELKKVMDKHNLRIFKLSDKEIGTAGI
jgi:hypothetical protein